MYYDHNDYEGAILRSSDLNQQSEHYRYGFELGENADNNNFELKYGEPIGGSTPWCDYLTGSRDKETILARQKFIELNLMGFEAELGILLRKYNVDLEFGCGCCGGGFYCDGLEWTELKKENYD